MNPILSSGLLQLISAAVTPVVMISACATLILGINAKHSGTADRVRQLTMQFRANGNTAERQENLIDQIRIFYRRFLITRAALWILYAAVTTFIADVLYILLSQKHILMSDNAALGLFMLGVVLMLLAVLMEFLEIKLSKQSLFLEVEDILRRPEAPAPVKPLATTLAKRFLGGRKSKPGP